MYNFFYPTNFNKLTLFNNREFKNKIDLLMANSKNIMFSGWDINEGVDLFQLIKLNFQDVLIVEKDSKNCKTLQDFKAFNIICDDIKNFKNFIKNNEYDTLILNNYNFNNDNDFLKNVKESFSNIIILFTKELNVQNILLKNNFIVQEFDQKDFYIGCYETK